MLSVEDKISTRIGRMQATLHSWEKWLMDPKFEVHEGQDEDERYTEAMQAWYEERMRQLHEDLDKLDELRPEIFGE